MSTTNTTLLKWLNKLTPGANKAKLGQLLDELITQHNALVNRMNNCIFTSGNLQIKAAASPTVKAALAITGVANGSVNQKNANTDMAALVGTLATAKSAAWAFYMDSAGTLTTSAKTADAADATAALALLPAIPANKAQIGYVIITNATGANFVGGTTALDTANLTVTYVNTPLITGQAPAMTLAEIGAR